MCRSRKYARLLLCLLLSIFAFGFVFPPPSSSLKNTSQSKLFSSLLTNEARQSRQTSGKVPLIILPGLAGSRMENDPNLDGKYGEVWPNGDRLVLDPWDRTLLALKLASNGGDPFGLEAQYATVRVGDIVRSEYGLDFYGSAIAFFTTQAGYIQGKDFFVCPYDWRKDLQEIAFGALPITLYSA